MDMHLLVQNIIYLQDVSTDFLELLVVPWFAIGEKCACKLYAFECPSTTSQNIEQATLATPCGPLYASKYVRCIYMHQISYPNEVGK